MISEILAGALLASASGGTVIVGGPFPTPSGGVPSLVVGRSDTPGSLQLRVQVPAGSYFRVERRIPGSPSSPWTPVALGLPAPNSAWVLRVSGGPASAAAIFRVAALPLELPDDTDRDGMDDVYEWRRNHALDPLEAGDAWDDADRDGVPNLMEYLSGSEAAPEHPAIPRVFDTWADLQAEARAPLPALIRLRGHARVDDGWGGWFTYRPDDVRSADGAMLVSAAPAFPGRLERVIDAGDAIQASWWRPPDDGEGDAGPSLQRALNHFAASGAARLVIAPGRYRVQAQIAYSDPTRAVLLAAGLSDFEIDGTGATLVAKEDGELLMMKDCRRGTIRGLALEGSGSDRGGTGPNYAMIQLIGDGSDLRFIGCRLRGFMHGISHLHGAKTTTRVTIRDCYFEDGGDSRYPALGMDGAAISGIGDDWTVENNVFHDCLRGIEVENTGSPHPISRVLIRGNRLTHVRNLGIMAWLGGVEDPSVQQSNLVIRDNVVIGKPGRHRYPDGSPIPVMPISLGGGSRWVISGNICQDGDYGGITLYSTQGPLDESVVTDNIVTDMTFRGIQVVSDPTWPTTGIVVANNRISRCGDRGLLLAADHVTAQGNQIEDVGVAGIAVGDSWLPQVECRGISVRRNTIRSVRGDGPGIVVLPNTLDTVISGNDISDAAVGIRIQAPTTLLDDNTFLRVPTESEWED